MPRFVTPQGVVVETSEAAAAAVGYKPAEAAPRKRATSRPKTRKAPPADSDSDTEAEADGDGD